MISAGIIGASRLEPPIVGVPGITILHDYTRNLDVLNNRPATDALTVTRASSRTATRGDGLIQTFADNVAAINDVGLWSGLGRTNGIRNSTNVGASLPSTLPTNWGVYEGGSISVDLEGFGTEDGHDYIDIRFSGTASNNNTASVSFESGIGIAASSGQVWTQSLLAKIVGGSTANIDLIRLAVNEHTAAGTYVKATATDNVLIKNTIDNTRRAFKGTVTLNGGGTVGRVRPYLDITFLSGAVIDLTIRIYDVQFEQGAFATDYIPTSGGAVARAADDIIIDGLDWFNATEGTLFAEFLAPLDGTTNYGIFSIDNGFDNSIALFAGSGTSPVFIVRSGGVDQAYLAAYSSLTRSAVNRIAARYKANDFARSANGGAVATDVSGTIPTVASAKVGRMGSEVKQLNGAVRRIAYFNRILSDAELQLVSNASFWSS